MHGYGKCFEDQRKIQNSLFCRGDDNSKVETIQGRCSDPKIKLPQGWIVQYSQTLRHQTIFDKPRFPCVMLKFKKKAANLSFSQASGLHAAC